MGELKTKQDHIRADCTIPVREVERLREVERAAREVIYEFTMTCELDGAEQRALEALRAALGREK